MNALKTWERLQQWERWELHYCKYQLRIKHEQYFLVFMWLVCFTAEFSAGHNKLREPKQPEVFLLLIKGFIRVNYEPFSEIIRNPTAAFSLLVSNCCCFTLCLSSEGNPSSWGFNTDASVMTADFQSSSSVCVCSVYKL